MFLARAFLFYLLGDYGKFWPTVLLDISLLYFPVSLSMDDVFSKHFPEVRSGLGACWGQGSAGRLI